MSRILYAVAAVLLIAFMLACFVALVAVLVLGLIPAIVGAAPAGCPIGMPPAECGPDIIELSRVYLPGLWR